MTNQKRYQQGMAMLELLHGGHIGKTMVDELGEISPAMRDMTIEWAFGEVVSRQGIDLKTRELVTIAACITHGALMPQLRAHYEAALKIGVSKAEIIEVILQMVFYAGMAAATNALRLLQDVIAEQAA